MKSNKLLQLGCFLCCALMVGFLLITPAQASDLSPEKIEQVEALIQELKKGVQDNTKLRKENGKLLPKAVRSQHPKSHGLLKAKFIVSPDIPNNLRRGLFAQPETYKAWVRFSNASSRINEKGELQSDWFPDLRAISIKVLDPPGKSLVDDKPEQDFILINHPVFFASNLENFVDVFKMLPILRTEKEEDIKAYIEKLPTAQRKKALSKSLRILNSMNTPNKLKVLEKGASPLNLTYWSTTPFKLGDENVQYLVIANRDNSMVSKPNKDNPNFLRSAMVEQLKEQDVTFDFAVLLPENPEELSINDATENWDIRSKSKSIVVATLQIPKQNFDSLMRRELDEELSFTPWHALPEHRPIGEINLARKEIYQELSKFRHELNNN
ncbi:MAG: catalase family protein [Crocosphaera sp.]